MHDSFLELGGDSLLATRLMARLREELAVDLPMDRLFAEPTVAAVAAAVVEARAAQAGEEDLARLLAEIGALSEEELEEELMADRDLDAALKDLTPRQRDLLLRRLEQEEGGRAPGGRAHPAPAARADGGDELPALLRPGAALVPRPPGAGEPAVQHPGGPGDRRAARRRRRWRPSLREIVRRHEALRTTFAAAPGGAGAGDPSGRDPA